MDLSYQSGLEVKARSQWAYARGTVLPPPARQSSSLIRLLVVDGVRGDFRQRRRPLRATTRQDMTNVILLKPDG